MIIGLMNVKLGSVALHSGSAKAVALLATKGICVGAFGPAALMLVGAASAGATLARWADQNMPTCDDVSNGFANSPFNPARRRG